MKKVLISLGLLISFGFLSSCKKDEDPVSQIDTDLNDQIIANYSLNVVNANYVTLSTKTSILYDQVQTLNTNRTDDNLIAVQQTWRTTRQTWEQSEAHLIGPVESENIDPRIDTWPVNFTDLDGQLSSGNAFTEDYINAQEDALKGFHPIEYVIFGTGGNKTASKLTDREMEYLIALSLNVKTLTANLAADWNTSNTSSFYTQFITAGKGSTVYTTQQAALEEMVNAMADIANEVGDSKMKEPYDQQNPSLEESPFSQNSMTDFINNITGIQNVYLGRYQTDGVGLEDMVKKYNLSLDTKVKEKLSAALTAMGNIKEPFGEAIINQHVLVENAMTALADLHDTLELELLPFVHQHSK